MWEYSCLDYGWFNYSLSIKYIKVHSFILLKLIQNSQINVTYSRQVWFQNMRARHQRNRSRVVEVSPMPRRVSPPTVSPTPLHKSPLPHHSSIPSTGLDLIPLKSDPALVSANQSPSTAGLDVKLKSRPSLVDCHPLDLSMPKCDPPLNLSMKTESQIDNVDVKSLGFYSTIFSFINGIIDVKTHSKVKHFYISN